ncbi:E3 ubiquitin-protein ligase RGLG2 [Sesamum angolense]|uniref:E3 ubiquitin-protein ligase RGLG2 n=1 Tax=Sesamum angolense TaxID=2727404 RepID=A0AAE1XDY3_9LAMI|nr:E3 ubiquitin-protein ligase RGLG2 [Sesamum angolense]
MGNKSSSSRDGGSWRQASTTRSTSSSGWQHDYAQSSFSQYAQNYPVQHPYPAEYPPQDQYYAPPQDQYYAPPQNYETPSVSHVPAQYNVPPPQVHAPHKKLDRRYSRIADNYRSLEEVTEALARAGLESSNLIIGIDFTKSNEWTGKRSYNSQSLHHIGSGLNPYEQAITIIGKTLAAFDDDNLIPCFGFGDASTHDQDVFSFYPEERFCNGFEEVLSRYRELVPNLKLAGPTSFAPIIEMAMTVVEQSGGQYHVLLIIADGQVTRSVDTEYGQLSPQEQKTVQAIVEASKLPLSIILVGVGDGPWDMMKEFDDNIPARDFDNFQFVNFTEIMVKNVHQTRKETEFALSALMEIPSQYKATMELNLLGGRKGNIPERVPLPPPVYGGAFGLSAKPSRTSMFQHSSSSYYEHNVSADTAPSAPSSTYEHQICPICLSSSKDMAFGCGHQLKEVDEIRLKTRLIECTIMEINSVGGFTDVNDNNDDGGISESVIGSEVTKILEKKSRSGEDCMAEICRLVLVLHLSLISECLQLSPYLSGVSWPASRVYAQSPFFFNLAEENPKRSISVWTAFSVMKLVRALLGNHRAAVRALGRRNFCAPSEEYLKRNYANNEAEYNTVIGSITSQRRHYLLRDVYDDMMLDGVKPERDTFHSLIVGTMKGARMQDAFFFRDEMKSMGLVPDVALYNYLISTCGKCKNSDQAIRLLEEMKRFEVKPTGQTYICLLHACAASGRLDQVYAIVRDLTAAGLGLNKFSYAGLIIAHKNKAALSDDTTSKIIELVEQSKGWSSVDQTKDNAENVMMGISEEELYNLPTAEYIHRRGGFIAKQLTVYHVAFHACADLGTSRFLYQMAIERLLEMLEKDGKTPDVFILLQVMRGYLHAGDIERGVKVFEDYMNSKRPPMVELYVTLAEGAMVGYTPRGMQLAQETLINMNSRGFFLNPKMGNDLLLAASGEKEREIPEDDPRLMLVSRTLNNLRLRVGTGGGR